MSKKNYPQNGSIFRVHKTENYTLMHNHHLRNKELPLKAKGLLSVIFSLPPDWNFSINGLATLSLDGRDSILSIHKTSGKIVPYTSTDCTANDFYVLLHEVQNSGSSAADFGMCRVLDGGEINRNKLILVNSEDELTDGFIAKLKTSGIIAVRVSEETKGDIL